METFTEAKEFTDNLNYQEQRERNLAGLTDEMVDEPIVEIVNGFNKLPYCFTLQSCYGHFVHSEKDNPHNLDPLPDTDTVFHIEYRIAYIAFCIENNDKGRRLFGALKEIPVINPENIQFGSAEWFWKRQVNSYALQVEPDRFKYQDTATLDYEEALTIEKTRNDFFIRIQTLIHRESQEA
jgi:hypothetical protein